MGHRHRLGLGELPVKRSSRQLQPMTLDRASPRKYWLKPPILKIRGFATSSSYPLKLKSPEVMLSLFLSASSSLLDPCRPLSQHFLAVMLARSDARAPGLPPTGQTCPTPRDSILPSTCFLFFSTSTLL